MQNSLTSGSTFKNLLRFSIPYLISCFLQTFYGLADLFIIGQFNGASAITAVSIGSQIMHMYTLITVGIAMGTTVLIGRSVGAGDKQKISRTIGTSTLLFALYSIVTMGILILCIRGIVSVLSTPAEAVAETQQYMLICFIGIPFIVAYNVLSGIFRGLGDTKSPMYFILAAGIINILLDLLLVGPFGMGAIGAALATVISQGCSVVLALLFLRRQLGDIRFSREDFSLDRMLLRAILQIGLPVAFQDGLIQISFLIITRIANGRGVEIAAAVGIVEKLISFIFLVPSAMLSAVAAISAQSIGAGEQERSRRTLRDALLICMVYGVLVSVICQFAAEEILGLFTKNEPQVILLGSQYLHTYVIDTFFAGIHFCFSGFFTAYGKSTYSFIHNMISIVTARVPGAYLASVLFPLTLTPMGLAAPAGSLISALICVFLYQRGRKKNFWS
ncbi:MAG: MATE family efflux transporter [Eubacteriales bacterium]|nr:MATE family efflux transporter [Eubacteriales bacterium]